MSFFFPFGEDSVFGIDRCSKLGQPFGPRPHSSCSLFCPLQRSLTFISITSSATFGAAAEGADGEGAPGADPAASLSSVAAIVFTVCPLLVVALDCSLPGLRGAIAGAGGARRGALIERARWRGAGETAGAALLLLLLAVPERSIGLKSDVAFILFFHFIEIQVFSLSLSLCLSLFLCSLSSHSSL